MTEQTRPRHPAVSDIALAPEQRLTPTQRLHEVTMQALSRTPREPECSVDLTLNAKGDVQIAVGAKGPDVSEVGKAVEAEFERLRAKYPRQNGEGK